MLVKGNDLGGRLTFRVEEQEREDGVGKGAACPREGLGKHGSGGKDNFYLFGVIGGWVSEA